MAEAFRAIGVSVKGIIADLGLSTDKTGADLVKFADDLANAAGGLKNLDTLWSDYYKNYFSSSEQAANTLKHLKDAVSTTFAAIGEDPAESMAKFRADFEKAFPTLTPQQIQIATPLLNFARQPTCTDTAC